MRIKTVDGDVLYTVKPGTQTDTKVRLRGKGVPSLRNKAIRGERAEMISPGKCGRVFTMEEMFAENGEPIDVGEEVLIKEIQGVKLIVEKIY